MRVDRHQRIAPPLTRAGKPIRGAAGRMSAEVVARIAAAAGLEGKWTGHSLRRGFATAARRQGQPLERIGRHGGWADGSTALLGYIEDDDKWTDNPITGL
ncbi:tyrosine-type recombinase/integrase [Planomonospora corallina]|uniref:Tyrosine-type recombinase/integrase n=1 Tax=Planomonospora corallina TaxID=1806052 RepID=A0ABV8IAY6_9ACTN